MSRLTSLYSEFGQSPWFDNIRRDWLDDGTLADLVASGVRGVTSNPAIFAKSFATSSAYDELVANADETDPEALFERLAINDVRDACDVLAPVYQSSLAEAANGTRRYRDGYVSLEVSPRLAHDTDGTIAAAKRLWADVGRPNLMIKIPATLEGLPAITEVLASGINVNVTLIFSVARYVEVMHAWTLGLEQLRARGGELAAVASVASFFVSRVDAAIDPLVIDAGLAGRVANAQVAAAYVAYLDVMETDRVDQLLTAGAQVQRPLWASTSTKNPAYDELLYVDFIVANESVNTMPDATLAAATSRADGGRSLLASRASATEASALLENLPASVDLIEITDRLERDGVASFISSYDELLGTVATKMRAS
jgi:transaldolase